MGAQVSQATAVRSSAHVLENVAESASNHRLRLAVPGWNGSEPGQFAMISPGAVSSVPRDDPNPESSKAKRGPRPKQTEQAKSSQSQVTLDGGGPSKYTGHPELMQGVARLAATSNQE